MKTSMILITQLLLICPFIIQSKKFLVRTGNNDSIIKLATNKYITQHIIFVILATVVT